MPEADYAAFRALDPFFAVVMEGLSKFVDGEHYFDSLDDDVLFEFRYDFPVRRKKRVAVPTSWRFIRDTAITSMRTTFFVAVAAVIGGGAMLLFIPSRVGRLRF